MSKPSDSKAPQQGQVRRRSPPLVPDGRIGRGRSSGRAAREARRKPTSRRPSASRPATRKPTTSRTTTASTATDGTTHMLMKRRDGSAGRARLQGYRRRPGFWRSRPPHVPAPLRAGRWRRRRARLDAARIGAQGAGRTEDRRRADRSQKEHLHALLGRLHRDRRSAERRLGRPGAGLGQPDQPRLALRQGRIRARTRAWRPPPEISDEARQRRVAEDILGPGDQRDRRQDARDPRQVRRRLGLSARAPRNSPTKAATCSANSRRSGAPTRSTTRRASATPPRSPASPIPGATAR